MYNINKEGRDVVTPDFELKITAYRLRHERQLFFIVPEKIQNKNKYSDNVTDKRQKLN